jgi:hypothetical protein
MIGTRGIGVVAALAAVAVAAGLLTGYPAQVGAATTIAVAAFVSLITTLDLAARAELRVRSLQRTADPAPPEQLRRVGETLAAAQVSEVRLFRELRPLFRSIAAMRLAGRGVDLDRHTEKARAILGDELWEVVRAEGPRGSNRLAGGISAAGLQGLIERLERI